ncbi:uncharacterized protein LOC129919229 [Episyrphus balteatus]|uniref:uncharacterized protein LOC129919229 n=1 Tax=Episyrphus balteatus TaxID=286459 RepID=UPI002485429B|nr:uncharacterized protein LOC129919229 [Episyrphus balteatus]
MQNLHGVTLPIWFVGSEPGVIISKNANGDTVIGGFIGQFFNSFVKKHNARLNTSNIDTSISVRDFYPRVVNGTVEILSGFALRVTIPAIFYSYPIIHYDWCLMLPIEPKIPIYKVFAFIFHWEAFVLTVLIFILLSISMSVAVRIKSGPHRTFNLFDFLFNIDCFRGMLGESLSEEQNASCSTKIIYSLIFLLGIMIFTSYDAFLQSFMTEPPTENIIRSFDQLQSSGLKIYIYETNFNLLLNLRPDLKKYSNIFDVESNYKTFLKYRDGLSTKHGHALNQVKWEFYKNQQSFFSQQLFRWSDELFIVRNIMSCFGLNENSIYRNILNSHIFQVQSAGLMDYWMKKAFNELLDIGRVKKLNFTINESPHPLRVEDLKWIWILIGFMYLVATLKFVGEIFVFKLRKRERI